MAGTFKKRGKDYAKIQGERTLPGKYYHSEEIYQEEIEKIFYKFWLYACRSEDIAKTGDFKVINVEDESIILLRDKENQIKAYFNVCRHRGTQLCTKDSGNFEAKNIQCPYHAWTYGLDGKLKTAPMMGQDKTFKKSNCNLYEAHVYDWEGFVFISLAKKPIPFEEHMEALIGKFSDWNMRELRVAHHIRYELKCNWKLILQNYQECYHCPGVHPLLCEHTPFQSAQHDFSNGPVIGGFMELTKKPGSMTMDGTPAGPALGNVYGDDLERVYYYSIFPNVLFTSSS